ncbi:MAG: AAA family ATPase [Candidatus Melainabacteria bacterium]|jgi:DNA transposition AAA+ family ATPase|nr:AAA family ATPase [Candidatus Melainabacteria bacterium]
MTEKTSFLITSQYRRFAEICNKSQTTKFIGLFYGKTGLGKTESAMHYTNWRTVEPLLEKPAAARLIPASVLHSAAAVFTPEVNVSVRKLESGIKVLRNRFDELVDQATNWHGIDGDVFYPHRFLKLLIIDEADRLKLSTLEVVRDIYDRKHLSILLIGSPGIDRRLRRAGYGQLHSRFNIIYEMQPLNSDEMSLFIAQKWLELKLPLTADDGVSKAIMRIANGNFRVLVRIFSEIERLQKLNCFPMITPDVIEVARKSLLLGMS